MKKGSSVEIVRVCKSLGDAYIVNARSRRGERRLVIHIPNPSIVETIGILSYLAIEAEEYFRRSWLL